MQFIWLLVIISSILGVILGITILNDAQSAFQETTAVAIAIAFSVIPFIFAQACEKFSTSAQRNTVPTSIAGSKWRPTRRRRGEGEQQSEERRHNPDP